MAALLFTAACGGGGSAADDGDGPIKVGSILDETGPLNIYGTAMSDATKLAIDDINDNGGVLGRDLDLVSYDAQSDNAKYTQFANEAAQKEHVSVLMGGVTSAAREAIRPVVDRTKTLYFYNEQYEGGVCDQNTFNAGVVPSQQLAALIPYAVKNFGKKVYVVAADYNYGQISASWVKKYAEEAGATVVGTEFVPLESSEFGSIINGIQSAKPDVVISLLVGGNHIAFYRQFASSGLNDTIKIASPTFGLGNEQVVLAGEAEGITVAFPYFQEIESEANTTFVDAWHAEYGDDYPYITDSAVAVWNGWHLWAAAVEKAGTLDRDKVIDALESGISYDGPGGTVTMDGPSHHVVQNISIGEATSEHSFKVLSTEEAVPPSFEQSVCDLVSEPDTNEQFTP
ncbi:ABC transporter substrate-binding protein [Nocardioides sp. LHG3406-4]|uniref:urea ABC transporter substrate-binding protein n=1 Tax=Nocardioides sp. LHG3406-4 TaxID=2804575 RepID=UPI003CEFCC12